MNRDELLAICDRALTPQSEWGNRDSAAAQRQLGECMALLLAGCEFYVIRVERETIWLNVQFHGFDWFEEHVVSDETFYLPTVARLDRTAGRDWY